MTLRDLFRVTATFHTISVIDTEGVPDQVWSFKDQGEDIVDEAFVHLNDDEDMNKEYSVHINQSGVIVESWNRSTEERTGVFVIDFKDIEGNFKE